MAIEQPAFISVGGLSVTTPQGSYSVGTLRIVHNISPLPDDSLATTISAQEINSATIQGSIRTFLAFNSGDRSGRPTSGTLIIGPTIVGDMRLDADSGDPDTFLLTVRNGEVTTTYIIPWSMRFAIDPIDTNGFVPGQ